MSSDRKDINVPSSVVIHEVALQRRVFTCRKEGTVSRVVFILSLCLILFYLAAVRVLTLVITSLHNIIT